MPRVAVYADKKSLPFFAHRGFRPMEKKDLPPGQCACLDTIRVDAGGGELFRLGVARPPTSRADAAKKHAAAGAPLGFKLPLLRHPVACSQSRSPCAGAARDADASRSVDVRFFFHTVFCTHIVPGAFRARRGT